MPRCAFIVLLALTALMPLAAERIYGPLWQGLTKKAAKGTDKFELTAATWFGTPSHEEFLSVGTLPNGDIVAVGNTWGPDFPTSPKPEILGRGEWYEVSEFVGGSPTFKDKRGRIRNSPLADTYPNKAGFMVVYAPDLQTIKRIVKFDWGIGTISKVAVLPDGDIVIGGRAMQAFTDTIANKTAHIHSYPRPDPDDYGTQFDEIADAKKKAKAIAKFRANMRKRYGEIFHEGVKMPGNAYVMRLKNLTEPQWVVTLEGYRDVRAELIVMKEQFIAFDAYGPKRVDLNTGKPDRAYAGGSTRGVRAFNKYTGQYYRGGYRNTGTGREPYKNPYLYSYAEDGTKEWEAYRWASSMVGHDRYRLVSDSSVYKVMPDAEGYLWLVVWSDGGNTVAMKNPFNLLAKPNRENMLGAHPWAAQLAGYAHLVRFNPDTLDFDAYQFWSSYLPRTGQANSAGVTHIGVLKDSSMVLTGSTSSCLIQTPNAFVQFPEYFWDQKALNKKGAPGAGYSGTYLTIFNKKMTAMRFSSYLPKMKVGGFSDGPDDGFLLAGSATAPYDRDTREESWGVVPIKNAIQPEFSGGKMDAHILLMHDPDEEGAK